MYSKYLKYKSINNNIQNNNGTVRHSITRINNNNSNNKNEIYKKINIKDKNYLINKEQAKNIKKTGTTFIKIDLSKYINNSKRETNISNVQHKTTLDASINE